MAEVRNPTCFATSEILKVAIIHYDSLRSSPLEVVRLTGEIQKVFWVRLSLGGTMKRILAVTILSIAGLMMIDKPVLHAREIATTTAAPKKTVVFACNMKAMSPE